MLAKQRDSPTYRSELRFKPGPDVGVLMVGGVVLNQDRPLAAVAPSHLFQETEISLGVEGAVLPILEPRTPELDGAENLHALALPGHRNFWWAAYAAPGGMQGRVLPETGFVGEDQRPVPRSGFFLRFG